MDHQNISRRNLFVGGAGLATTALSSTQEMRAPITAGQVIERIKANVGVPWREKTVDNIIAGAPDTPVKGIATSMMATLDVIQRAAAAGKNMVITHESTFFSHQDTTDQLTNDPTYQYKLDFCRRHGIVSFHFHDH